MQQLWSINQSNLPQRRDGAERIAMETIYLHFIFIIPSHAMDKERGKCVRVCVCIFWG